MRPMRFQILEIGEELLVRRSSPNLTFLKAHSYETALRSPQRRSAPACAQNRVTCKKANPYCMLIARNPGAHIELTHGLPQ